jgi:hypothetical protein
VVRVDANWPCAKVMRPRVLLTWARSAGNVASFHLGHRRIAVNPELRHEFGDDAEEAVAIVEPRTGEIENGRRHAAPMRESRGRQRHPRWCRTPQ